MPIDAITMQYQNEPIFRPPYSKDEQRDIKYDHTIINFNHCVSPPIFPHFLLPPLDVLPTSLLQEIFILNENVYILTNTTISSSIFFIRNKSYGHLRINYRYEKEIRARDSKVKKERANI